MDGKIVKSSVFNSGRPYDVDGQVIYWYVVTDEETALRWCFFRDKSRGIDGKFSVGYHVDLDSDAMKSTIMYIYDRYVYSDTSCVTLDRLMEHRGNSIVKGLYL